MDNLVEANFSGSHVLWKIT